MNEAFLRQRRNVFVVCAILWALCLGGVNIQGLTLAGMKFGSFKRPEVFLYGVWLAFAYISYRYVVYFRGFSPNVVKQEFFREMSSAIDNRIFEVVQRDVPNAVNRKLTYELFLSWGREYRGDSARHGPFKLTIPVRLTFWWEFRGLLRFVFLTPALTEHLLPLALPVVTLVYCGFVADWQGNLSGPLRSLIGLG